MLRPPKSMFQDSIILKHTEENQDDPYGEGGTITETTINNVRFDERTVYSGSNNDRQVVANATIVCMSTYTEPFYEFTEKNQGDKVIFNDHEYTITSINRDIEPFNRSVYQYKLGVI